MRPGTGAAAPSPHTPFPVAQGLSPGQSGSPARGERLREGGRGRCRVPGWRGRPQRRSAGARPRNARPPGSSRRRRRRRNNPESMRRKYQIGGGGGGRARPSRDVSAPHPRCWRLQLRAPPPPQHTWASNGGKGVPGLGWPGHNLGGGRGGALSGEHIRGILSTGPRGRVRTPRFLRGAGPVRVGGSRKGPAPALGWGGAPPDLLGWGGGQRPASPLPESRVRVGKRPGRPGRGGSPEGGSGQGSPAQPIPHRPLARGGGTPGGAAGGTRAFPVPPPPASRLRGRAAGGAGGAGRARGVPGSGRAGTNTSRARREAQGRPERAR